MLDKHIPAKKYYGCKKKWKQMIN